ncbi:hypothetical protein [Massilia sp.]|uniref:hypothetical protein n=1 Tax=Massilia sp. TaxID=1882437 RepID=UPI0028A219F6|nr:hypothetical protein [Massilia sp.]
MHIERITFDRVFDAVESIGDFSFDSAGRRVFAARFGPGAVPRQGATYAIAFSRPGDWGTVLGWRDLATPTVLLRERARDPFWLDIAINIDIVIVIVVAVIVPVLILVLLGLAAGCAAFAMLLGLVHALVRSAGRRKDAVRARLLQEVA